MIPDIGQIEVMKKKLILLAVAATLSINSQFSTLANENSSSRSLDSLAQNAISTNTETAASAIARLRAKGPAGLDALFATHAALLQLHKQVGIAAIPAAKSGAWLRLQNALDSVGAQHDCAASHLYWYTNLDDAKAAAQAANKPILSLRLLGKLNEEYSCANSRFFRTTLYANAEVSKYLRDHFIMHWQSERPVPRITVDFGDGRKIERTITGNSIHYVLTAGGHVIDALPGLYGPQAFLKGVADAEGAAATYARLRADGEQKMTASLLDCVGQPLKTAAINLDADANAFLREYHRNRAEAIEQAFKADMKELAKSLSAAADYPNTQSLQNADESIWIRLAALHSKDAALDFASIRLIKSKNPSAIDAGRAAVSKRAVESPLTSMLQKLNRTIAEDTVRNEYLLHSQIHRWFFNGTAPDDLNQFNSLVYAQLFLTPESDPWLGLAPRNTFTGLDNNGLAQNAAH